MHIFVSSMQALEWRPAVAAIFNIVCLYLSQPAVFCFDISWYKYIVIQEVNVAKKGSDQERQTVLALLSNFMYFSVSFLRLGAILILFVSIQVCGYARKDHKSWEFQEVNANLT